MILTPGGERVPNRLHEAVGRREYPDANTPGPIGRQDPGPPHALKLDLPDRRALAAWRPWQEGTERRGLFAPLLKPFAGVGRGAVIVVLAVVLTVVLGRLDQEKYFELALDCVPRDDADQFVDVSIGWKVDLPITGPATVIMWDSPSPEWRDTNFILDIPEGVAVDWESQLVETAHGGLVLHVIHLEDGSQPALDDTGGPWVAQLVLGDTGRVWAQDTTSRASAIAVWHIRNSIRRLCQQPPRPPGRSGG